MTWKTIVVPHDFSASANHAVALARDLSKVHGANLILLHVIDLPASMGPEVVIPGDGEGPIGVKEYAMQGAEEHLADIVARLAKDEVVATPFIRIGLPVDEILRLCEAQKADLIVMGTHGRTGIRHLILGSVTEQVVRAAKIPVLTVRHPDEA